MPKKKSKSSDSPADDAQADASAHADAVVYVTYYGLEASALQRTALDERKAAHINVALNGLVQDRKLTRRDIDARTMRGQAAISAATIRAQNLVDGYEKLTLPPLVVTPKGGSPIIIRGGVSAVSATEWKSVASHKWIAKAVEDGRLLGPDETGTMASTKDQDVLVDLAARTHCPRGLAWLHGREVARKNPRARVLGACVKRAERMDLKLQEAAA